MPSWGFLLVLLFPWARKFTPIASATQLLNRENIVIVCNQGTAENSFIADVIIPVEKSQKKLLLVYDESRKI